MDPIETIDAIFDLLRDKLASTTTDDPANRAAFDAARRSIKCVALYHHLIDYTVDDFDLENILSSS